MVDAWGELLDLGRQIHRGEVKPREYRKISKADLEAILEAHKRWLDSDGKEGQQADLSQADLSMVDLRVAELSLAILREAKLSMAKLDEALLAQADLEQADLTRAELASAELSGANLQRAALLRANLEGANLVRAKLQGAGVYGANLQGACLYGANLTEATLLEADLRGADLREATLKGADLSRARFGPKTATADGEPTRDRPAADLTDANFRDADLRDADMSGVLGLQVGNLAGANLSNAKLPDDIARFDAIDHVAELSKHARNIFLGVIGACVYSWLTIATTRDVALITGSTATPLPIIQTPVSISGFYLAAPPILLALYFYLHLYLQRMWEGMAELPATFPDGRTLDKRIYPWLLSGLVSANVPRLTDQRPAMSWLQTLLSKVGAWVLVPFTMLLFWARYLVRHEWPWSIWHVVLFVTSAAFGFASYRLAIRTLRGLPQNKQRIVGSGRLPTWRSVAQGLRNFEHRWVLTTAVLTFGLTLGAIEGSTRGGPEDWRYWLPSPTTLIGFATTADLRNAQISTKPANWTGLAERPKEELENQRDLIERARAEMAQVKGAALEGVNLRGANGFGAFFAKSEFSGAKLQAANLAEANFQQANLSGANLQGTVLIAANLQEANLAKAKLQGADLVGANLQEANLAEAKLQDADLIGAKLEGARLRGADLLKAKLSDAKLQDAKVHWANLQGADLSDANLQKSKFYGANLQGADLSNAKLQDSDLRRANLEKADLSGANLKEANLKEANLTKAKLGFTSRHTVLGLSRAQLASACGVPETRLPPGYKIKPCTK